MVQENFTNLHFPVFIIYPLGIAKALGLVAILSNKSKVLKEWAYACFVFNTILAVGAHVNVGDGKFSPALICLILFVLSYFSSFEKDVEKSYSL